jgi:TRAP transporter TAXI family solute receptor
MVKLVSTLAATAVAVLTLALAQVPTANAQDQFIRIATGPNGGTIYPVGVVMAKIWTNNIPGLKATAQPSGGTRNNIQLLSDGEAEAAFGDGLTYDAFYGLNSYDGYPHNFLRTMVALYPEVIHVLVSKKSGIKSLAGLKGKRVSIGAVGSSSSAIMSLLLKIVGIDIDKDIYAEYLGHADAVAGLAENRIDAALILDAVDSISVKDATSRGVAEILPIPLKVIEAVGYEIPYFTLFVINPRTYPGQEEAITTFSSPTALLIHEKMHPIMVYSMTKALFHNRPDLVAVVKVIDVLTPEDATKLKIPIHPGAELYFREISNVGK